MARFLKNKWPPRAGALVLGDDSCPRSRGFKSQHYILAGYFFTLICCKNCVNYLKRPKINKKRPRMAHLINGRHSSMDPYAPTILKPRVRIKITSMLF